MEETVDNLTIFQITLFVLISGAVIYLGNTYYPDVKWFFTPSIVCIFLFVFFFSLGRGIIWKSRYHSYQINVNGYHGSIYGKPEYIKDDSVRQGFVWAVFNVGHSTFPISLRGKLGTLVVPADQIFPAGKGFIGLTLVQRYPLGGLPSKVHAYLRHNESSFNQQNIYFGRYSQSFFDNSVTQDGLQTQIKAKDTLIGVLEKAVESQFGAFEEIKEFADRINKTPSFIQKMTAKVKGKEDDE